MLTESITIILLSAPHRMPAEVEGDVEVLELGFSEDGAGVPGYVEEFGVGVAPIVIHAQI